MRRRHACALLAATLAGVAGSCGGGGTSLQPFQPAGNDANVRVVNAAFEPASVVVNGTLLSASLAYSTGTGCFQTNSTTSGIEMRYPDDTTAYEQNGLDFIPGETANLFVTKLDTLYRFFRVPAETTSTGGLARMRVVNISGGGDYDIHVTAPDAALVTPTDTGFQHGDIGSPFNVAPGERHTRLTPRGSIAVVLDLGTKTWLAGDRQVVVVAPPVTGTTTPRGFMWTGAKC